MRCAEGKSKYLKRLKRHNHTPLHNHSRNTLTLLDKKNESNDYVFFLSISITLCKNSLLFSHSVCSILYTSDSQPLVRLPMLVPWKNFNWVLNLNQAVSKDFKKLNVTLNLKDIIHDKPKRLRTPDLHQWLYLAYFFCSFFYISSYSNWTILTGFQVQFAPDLHIF